MADQTLPFYNNNNNNNNNDNISYNTIKILLLFLLFMLNCFDVLSAKVYVSCANWKYFFATFINIAYVVSLAI